LGGWPICGLGPSTDLLRGGGVAFTRTVRGAVRKRYLGSDLVIELQGFLVWAIDVLRVDIFTSTRQKERLGASYLSINSILPKPKFRVRYPWASLTYSSVTIHILAMAMLVLVLIRKKYKTHRHSTLSSSVNKNLTQERDIAPKTRPRNHYQIFKRGFLHLTGQFHPAKDEDDHVKAAQNDISEITYLRHYHPASYLEPIQSIQPRAEDPYLGYSLRGFQTTHSPALKTNQNAKV
jgi:hypothetical protein